MEFIPKGIKLLLTLLILCNNVSFSYLQEGRKIRMCVVAARNSGAQIARLCKELASSDEAAVECTEYAPDRLTCLRRVVKGRADMTTLEAEDLLVAVRRDTDDISVTNELRTIAKWKYEYEVAAVVRKSSKINSTSQLRNSTFCHPGFGYETDWTGVVSRFLESRVVPQRCDPTLTLAENGLNSSAQFFLSACKAGPWVPDPQLDAELKSRYASLCSLCDVPHECSTLDKFWGRLGPLFCLTDGAGDVLWARLDHIRNHFAPEDSSTAEGVISDYSLLCPDGSLEPLSVITNKNSSPCVWISRPWPVVVAHRRKAAEVQHLVKELLVAESGSWETTFGLLVAPLQQHTPPTRTISTLEERLGTAPGWLSATTASTCGALGSLRFCVSGGLASSKCQWLAEASRAYGVRGSLLCVRARDCLTAVRDGQADITSLHPDVISNATRDYGLKVLMYEQPKVAEKLYLATAVVKNPNLQSFNDLRGKRVCFPALYGTSWQLTMAALRMRGFIPETCDDDTAAMLSFFSSICVAQGGGSKVPSCEPALPPSEPGDTDAVSADHAAIQCLAQGNGDVAIVNKGILDYLHTSQETEGWLQNLRARDFRFACFMNLQQGCPIGWAPHGMIVTRNTERGAKIRQWRTMLEILDELFGPSHRSPTPALLMYGVFDNHTNVIFHNSTHQLVDYEVLAQEAQAYPIDLIQVLRSRQSACPPSLASRSSAVLWVILIFSWSLALC